MLAYYLHNLDPIIFRISDNVGPRWYGLSYVLAFICGYLLFLWLAERGYADLAPQRVGDFITGCALFGVIIGGRLGYVFFLQARNVARAAVDLARLGRRHVKPRRDAWLVDVHVLLCPPAQNLVD